MYHTLMYSGMLLGVCDKRSHCGPLLSRYCIMPSHMSSNQASRGCPRVTIQQTVHETKTVLQEGFLEEVLCFSLHSQEQLGKVAVALQGCRVYLRPSHTGR